jgi:nucleotide-binding universal stress UspA family protein
MHGAPAALDKRSDSEEVGLVPVEGGPPSLIAAGGRLIINGCDYSGRQKLQELAVRKILVATDFSAASVKAAERAATVASRYKAALTVLHVIDINSQARAGTAEDLMKSLWTKASTQMGELGGSLSNHAPTHTMLAEGLPWEVVVEKSRDFDLLVIGQRPNRWFPKVFSHQTTQRVVENSACPVLVVDAPG